MSSNYLSHFAAAIGGALAPAAYFYYSCPLTICRIESNEQLSVPLTAFNAAMYSVGKTQGLCKTLEYALSIMRGIVKLSNLALEEQLELESMFDVLQSFDYTTHDPNLKILAIEGLQGCGKSKLILNLQHRLQHIYAIDENFKFPFAFDSLSKYLEKQLESEFANDKNLSAVCKLVWKLIKLYYVMHEIRRNQTNSSQLIIISNYYHELCAETLYFELNQSDCSVPTSTAVHETNEFYQYFANQRIFEWPFDLPKPDLVCRNCNCHE